MPLANVTDSQLTFPDPSSQTVYCPFGQPLPTDVSQTIYEKVWSCARDAIEYSDTQWKNIPPPWNVYDFCISRAGEDARADPSHQGLFSHMLDILTTFTAVDVRKQSLRHYRVEATLPVCLLTYASNHRVNLLLWHPHMQVSYAT